MPFYESLNMLFHGISESNAQIPWPAYRQSQTNIDEPPASLNNPLMVGSTKPGELISEIESGQANPMNDNSPPTLYTVLIHQLAIFHT